MPVQFCSALLDHICSLHLSIILKLLFRVFCSEVAYTPLQVSEEASPASVILQSIHQGGQTCSERKQRQKRSRSMGLTFIRIFSSSVRLHTDCILNRFLPNATVPPGCNRGIYFQYFPPIAQDQSQRTIPLLLSNYCLITQSFCDLC